jgi:hypothetical protein
MFPFSYLKVVKKKIKVGNLWQILLVADHQLIIALFQQQEL